jgi:hypothetical protein
VEGSLFAFVMDRNMPTLGSENEKITVCKMTMSIRERERERANSVPSSPKEQKNQTVIYYESSS